MLSKKKVYRLVIILLPIFLLIMLSLSSYISGDPPGNSTEFPSLTIPPGWSRNFPEVANFSDKGFSLKAPPGKMKNNIITLPPGTQITTAEELLESIPDAVAVNWQDPETNKTYGWTNVRGGRGINFEIKPNTPYEVYLKDPVDWTPPSLKP